MKLLRLGLDKFCYLSLENLSFNYVSELIQFISLILDFNQDPKQIVMVTINQLQTLFAFSLEGNTGIREGIYGVFTDPTLRMIHLDR